MLLDLKRLDGLNRRLADRILPWASANAHVWPSQHAVQESLLADLKKLHQEHEALKVSYEHLHRSFWKQGVEIVDLRQKLTKATMALEERERRGA